MKGIIRNKVRTQLNTIQNDIEHTKSYEQNNVKKLFSGILNFHPFTQPQASEFVLLFKRNITDQIKIAIFYSTRIFCKKYFRLFQSSLGRPLKIEFFITQNFDKFIFSNFGPASKNKGNKKKVEHWLRNSGEYQPGGKDDIDQGSDRAKYRCGLHFFRTDFCPEIVD